MNPCGQQLTLQHLYGFAQVLLEGATSRSFTAVHTCAVQCWDLAGPVAGPHIHVSLLPSGLCWPSHSPG